MSNLMKIYKFIPLAVIPLIILVSCKQQNQKAEATLESKSGSNVKGKVTFTKEGDMIKVVADIEGLPPGQHGFHIHEKGDCSAPDGTSAGGHFNPMSEPHAGHDAPQRHVGDMGNITADASGKAHIELTDTMMSFEGNNSIIGKSVIVHEKADDLTSQPSGNAGARIACGVIVMSN